MYYEERGLNPDDRPNIICRIFKIKLDSLMFDLTEKHLLGKTVAGKLIIIVFILVVYIYICLKYL